MVELRINGLIEQGSPLPNKILNLRGQRLIVRIDSIGGNLFMANKIADAIELHGDCETIATHAASAAAMIFIAGKRRLIAANGCLMVHRASMTLEVSGNCKAFERIASDLRTSDQLMVHRLVSRLNVSTLQASQWIEQETTFTASQAVEHGIAHAIVGKPRCKLTERVAKLIAEQRQAVGR